MSERIILGIDPGTNIMGYGIIRIMNYELGIKNIKSSELQSLKNKNKEIELIKLDVIKLNSLKGHALKLKSIFETSLSLINDYKPDELAIEAPFFGKNIQSMLKLGRAQGVAMAAALYREIPIFEYSPRKIKQSITGNGSASKEQVSAMLISMMKINEVPEYLDATDALAVAVCHYFQSQTSNLRPQTSKFTGGKLSFLKTPKELRVKVCKVHKVIKLIVSGLIYK